MINRRFPLPDGALARRMPSAEETVAAMAEVLRESRIGFDDEAGAIRALAGRGFSTSEISFHLYDARIEAAS